MISVFLVGKTTPILLKSARFTAKHIEGICEDGGQCKLRYDQVKDIQTDERETNEKNKGPSP